MADARHDDVDARVAGRKEGPRIAALSREATNRLRLWHTQYLLMFKKQ